MSDIKVEYIGSDVSFSDSECNEIYTVPTKFWSTSKNKGSNQFAIQEEQLCYQNEVNICLPDLHDICNKPRQSKDIKQELTTSSVLSVIQKPIVNSSYDSKRLLQPSITHDTVLFSRVNSHYPKNIYKSSATSQ